MKKAELFKWTTLTLIFFTINCARAFQSPKGGIKHIDTVYAGKKMAGADYIKSVNARFIILISVKNTYKTVSLLNRTVTVDHDRITVVQKLSTGTNTNTDSVITDSQTLLPLESYSDISTSSDSFVYIKNRLTGTMKSKEVNNAGVTKKIDTLLSHSFFNGLIYAETYQSIQYVKNKAFYLAEFVPGHQQKFTYVEYKRDENITFAGKKIASKVIETKIGETSITLWLDAKSQQLLKTEGKFPKFTYMMLRAI